MILRGYTWLYYPILIAAYHGKSQKGPWKRVLKTAEKIAGEMHKFSRLDPLFID